MPVFVCFEATIKSKSPQTPHTIGIQSFCLPTNNSCIVQVDDFLEKSTREERQGLAVEGIPDADLFYEDKVRQQPPNRPNPLSPPHTHSPPLPLPFP